MDRKHFLKSLLALPFIGGVMKLQSLRAYSDNLESSERMPVLFLGHGSPMNAIEENEFVKGFRDISHHLPKPKAILCISAHWETRGTFVTAMANPRTIHDFGGFPQELYDVQYPAPGSPELAADVQKMVTKASVHLDEDQWGLDHGAWTAIKHIYPNADIPVIQMSIDYTKPAQYHAELAQQLSVLRDKGILIVGSGNMVHNLRLVSWQKLNEQFAYDWAEEANDKMKSFISDGNLNALIDYKKQGKSFELAIPTPEHYLPLIYSMSLKNEKEEIFVFNDKPVAGSLAMTSVAFGKLK